MEVTEDLLFDEYMLLVPLYFKQVEDNIKEVKDVIAAVDSGLMEKTWVYDNLKGCVPIMEYKQSCELDDHEDVISNPTLPLNRNKMQRFLNAHGDKFKKIVFDV